MNGGKEVINDKPQEERPVLRGCWGGVGLLFPGTEAVSRALAGSGTMWPVVVG